MSNIRVTVVDDQTLIREGLASLLALAPDLTVVGQAAAGREWLAQVEHIPGGEKQYFASLEDLFAFIRAQLPGSSQEPHGT